MVVTKWLQHCHSLGGRLNKEMCIYIYYYYFTHQIGLEDVADFGDLDLEGEKEGDGDDSDGNDDSMETEPCNDQPEPCVEPAEEEEKPKGADMEEDLEEEREDDRPVNNMEGENEEEVLS